MNLEISNLKSTYLNPSTSPDKKATALAELRTLAATNPEARGVVEEIEAEGLKKVSLLIATPAYGANITTHYCLSLIRLMDTLRSLGVEHELRFVTHHSLITKARCAIANHFFFDTKHTHVLMIDADISWDATDVVRALTADCDVIGLPCANKGIDWSKVAEAARAGVAVADLPRIATFPIVNLLKYGVEYDGSKLIEVKQVGTGMLVVKRGVFQKLSEAHPEWKYSLINAEREHARDFAFAFFGTGIDAERHLLSEDFKFSADWRALGGRVYLAAWAKTSHHGSFPYRYDATPIKVTGQPSIPAVKNS